METLNSDAAYLMRSTSCPSMERALAFAREHVGLTMIDALSRFKRILIEQDQRRAQEIAETLLTNAGESARRTSGCVVTNRASYQYRPESPRKSHDDSKGKGRSKSKKGKAKGIVDFDDDDSVYVL